MKRTKPAPRRTRELLAKSSQNVAAGSYKDCSMSTSALISSNPGGSVILARPVPPEMRDEKIRPSPDLRFEDTVDSRSLLLVPSFPSKLLSDTSLINSSLPSLDLVRPPSSVRHTYDMIAAASTSRIFGEFDPNEDSDDDNDPEGVRVILCAVPNVDKNVKANTLPFVLYCYSQWAIATVFEPRKVMHTLRDQVVARFSSENTRTRSILIANVMNMFVKSFAVDGASKSILDHLTLEVQNSGAAFMASPPSFVPAVDRQKAIRILDNMVEIIALQLDTHPISECVQSFENAAPIFRRACPESLGRFINLPNILLDLSLNLRHFATMDIIKSVVTGQPSCFQYEVPFSLELCERVYQWQLGGNYGLQWLYGLPDQYLMLFAWINTMSETPEADANTLIAWVEKHFPQIKVAIDDSGDPSLRIGRMVVLESWRFTVLIYLYLVLGRVSAYDPRVVRAQKGFMRLLRGMKPGRNPDAYLIISMTVIGVVTIDERDRDTLRRRILGVGEYAEQGTAGNDVTLMLGDIWTRTKDEGRAAVWSDLSIAYSRLPRR